MIPCKMTHPRRRNILSTPPPGTKSQHSLASQRQIFEFLQQHTDDYTCLQNLIHTIYAIFFTAGGRVPISFLCFSKIVLTSTYCLVPLSFCDGAFKSTRNLHSKIHYQVAKYAVSSLLLKRSSMFHRVILKRTVFTATE